MNRGIGPFLKPDKRVSIDTNSKVNTNALSQNRWKQNKVLLIGIGCVQIHDF
jgi:hypothetical protein